MRFASLNMRHLKGYDPAVNLLEINETPGA